MKQRTFLAHIVAATGILCLATFHADAQQAGGGGAGGARGPMGGMLTQEQRTKLREASQESRADLTKLNEKLAAAQKEAVKAALAKDADDKTVRAKVEEVAKIQTDIAILRLKAVKEISSTVTDEQKTQMESAPGMAYNMLLGSFGGGFGGGQGGQGGARRGGARTGN